MIPTIPRDVLRFMCMLLFIGGGAFSASAQIQVTIDANRDNTLYESASGATSNGAGDNFFVGRTNQTSNSIRRGLIRFDVAARIPANATITSATLTLSMSRTTSGNQTVTLHRASAAWSTLARAVGLWSIRSIAMLIDNGMKTPRQIAASTSDGQ